MGKRMRWNGFGVAVAVSVVLLLGSVAASASKPARSRFHHVLITFSGSGKGNYSYSYPEDDVGDDPGTCTEPSNAYSTVDRFTFEWSEKLSFPEGVGSYVKQYRAGGTDVTTQQQGSCTNGFGNSLGGNSFGPCTTRYNPLPSSDTEYPTVVMGGPASHLVARVRGGVTPNGVPIGANCVGQSLGGSVDSFSGNLKGSLSFSAAKLERQGSLSKAASGTAHVSCSSTGCDRGCQNDVNPPADVPTTCSSQQSFTGEVKVQLVR